MKMGKINVNHQPGLLLTIALLLQFLVSACSLKEARTHISKHNHKEKQHAYRISEQRFPLQNKQLVVLVDSSPYNYAIVDGAPVGLTYGLLNLFAQDQGLTLVIKVISDNKYLLDSLQAGIGDIATPGFNGMIEHSTKVDFTAPLLTDDIRLVGRTHTVSANQHSSSPDSLFDLRQLDTKKIIIKNSAALQDILTDYAKTNNLGFIVEQAAEHLSQEDLVEMVASGKIDYTVAAGNVAEAMSAQYKNLDYQTPIARSLPVQWAVNKQSVGLQQRLNEWIVKRKGTLEFNMIINKYTQLSKTEKNAVRNQYLQAKKGAISPYDELLKTYAHSANWDWRLLAALVYQESKFDPKAKSGAGAIGLMQVLPSTAKWLGNKQHSLTSPEANIRMGMQYLQWLKAKWEQTLDSEEEVIKFTLASYNAGFGHVRDAYRLAKKHNLNPQKWDDNVERMLLAKSEAKIYQDPQVQYGYCRGKEPVEYVRNIMYYYQHYQNI